MREKDVNNLSVSSQSQEPSLGTRYSKAVLTAGSFSDRTPQFTVNSPNDVEFRSKIVQHGRQVFSGEASLVRALQTAEGLRRPLRLASPANPSPQDPFLLFRQALTGRVWHPASMSVRPGRGYAGRSILARK